MSFDLIYARPGQTPDAWERELNSAIDLAADHLSLYQLTIEDGKLTGVAADGTASPYGAYMCPKGRASLAFHNGAENRLLNSLRRGDMALQLRHVDMGQHVDSVSRSCSFVGWAMLLGSFDIRSVDAPGGPDAEAEERMSFTMVPVGLTMKVVERG